MQNFKKSFMLGYYIFTITWALFASLAAVGVNRLICVLQGKTAFLQNWKGWQISFLVRVAGMSLLFMYLGMLFQSGYIAFVLSQKLIATAFAIFLIGFFLDFIFSWHRLQKKEFSSLIVRNTNINKDFTGRLK